MKIYITYEKLSNSKYMSAMRILPFQRFAGISYSILNALFEGSQDLFSKLSFRNSLIRTDLKIRLSKLRGYIRLPG